jgi:protein-tyrosine-phosphatase
MPNVRNFFPAAIALLVSTLSAAAILSYFAIQNGMADNVRRDRDTALAEAGRAGLPTRYDAFRMPRTAPEEVTPVLLKFQEAYGVRKKRVRKSIARANRESEAIVLAIQLVESSPELVRLSGDILQRKWVAHREEPDLGLEQTTAALAPLKPFQRFLNCRIAAKIHQGKVSDAITLMEQHQGFVRDICQTPTIALAMLDARHTRNSVPLLLHLASSGQLMPEDWTQAERLLEDPILSPTKAQTGTERATVGRAYRVEFARSLGQVRLADRDRARVYATGTGHPTAKIHHPDAIASAAKHDAAVAHYFRYATKVHRALNTPADRIASMLENLKLIDQTMLSEKDPKHEVARAWRIDLEGPLQSEAHATATRRAARIYLDVLRRHGPRGPFPAQLQNLPTEPFSGLPFVYRRSETGFEIFVESSPNRPLSFRHPMPMPDLPW